MTSTSTKCPNTTSQTNGFEVVGQKGMKKLKDRRRRKLEREIEEEAERIVEKKLEDEEFDTALTQEESTYTVENEEFLLSSIDESSFETPAKPVRCASVPNAPRKPIRRRFIPTKTTDSSPVKRTLIVDDSKLKAEDKNKNVFDILEDFD
jgi:hypothetical protein